MTRIDGAALAERTSAVERHLARVAERCPSEGGALAPMTDASDAVILHLWQAIQLVLDIALSTCVRLHLGAPAGYADAFQKLAAGGYLEPGLAARLAQAAGMRNRVAHAYEGLDMKRVHAAATSGPADLRAFLAAMAKLT